MLSRFCLCVPLLSFLLSLFYALCQVFLLLACLPCVAVAMLNDLELDNGSAATATLDLEPEPELEPLKPQVRFYSVGPSTYRVKCPLCRQNARSETVEMGGTLGQLSCMLSVLSCCFPIFALTCVYSCLQSRLKSKRVFCSSCGGHLGFHWRPI